MLLARRADLAVSSRERAVASSFRLGALSLLAADLEAWWLPERLPSGYPLAMAPESLTAMMSADRVEVSGGETEALRWGQKCSEGLADR